MSAGVTGGHPSLRHSPGLGAWCRLAFGLLGTLLGSGCLSATDKPGEAEPADRPILNHWIEALGGPWDIKALKSAEYHCKISFGTNSPPIDTYIRATSTGAYRYDYELPAFGRLTQAYDGQSAWQKNDMLGFGPVGAAAHAQNLAGTDFRAPMRVGTQFPKRRRLPDETIAGRRLQVLEMTDQADGRSKWYFDPESGMRVRIEAAIGAETVVIEFSDFRRVQGIQEPFHTVRRSAGQFTEITMLSILYNEPADPLLFSPPAAWLDDNREMERILQENDRRTGNAALRQVNTRVTKMRMDNTTSGIRIASTTFQKRPNLIVSRQEIPGIGEEWQGFDGKTGWASSELQGFRTMQGPELQQMVGNADIDGPLRLRDLCPLRRLLGETVEKDRTLVGIALATLQGPAGNFYFDTQTYLLVRMETYVQAGASGQLKITADFSDFRPVDGLKVPFVTVITNPAMRLVTTIESIEQNVPLEEAFFAPRKD